MPIFRKNHGTGSGFLALFCYVTLFLFSLPSLVRAIELSALELTYLSAKDTIVFVSQTHYPPFEFVDANGQHEGMMLDIIRWIAVEAGFKPIFIDMTFQQAQEAVLNGKADIITSLFYSDKRKEKFEFTKPLFDVPASIFMKAERTDIKDIKDLNGKLIAMQWGDYAKEFLESKNTYFFTLVTKDFSEATTRVVAGQADAVVGDEQVVYYHIFSNRLTGSMKKVGEPLYIGQNCMAASRNNTLLIGILNKGINEAIRSGQLEKITTKWLGTTITSHESSFLDRYRWHVAAGVGGLLLLLLLIWVWNVRLRLLVQNKTADITLREEALRASEARYRSILNASADDITITDMQGRIIMVSPAAVTLFGYDLEEAGIGRMVTDFIAPEDRDRALSNIALKFQGTTTGPGEYRGLRMDGSVFDIEVNSDFIRTADGQPSGMVFVVRDITARKKAEEALRSSQKQLKDIIEFLPDATLAIDTKGRVIIWNKAIETMTGIPAAKMIGKGDHVYTIPFYGVARPQLMDLIFKDEEEVAVLYPHIIREADTLMTEAFCNALYSNKGAWIFAKASPLRDQAGNIIGAIESIRDITKIKNSQVELEQKERYFRALFENAGDAIFIEDENDRILDVNNRACDLLGYTRQELLQMHVPDLQAPELRGRQGSVVKDGLARRRGVPFETIDVKKDGTLVMVEVATVPLAAGDNNLALSIVRDITERKHLQSQFIQAQKMEAVGQLAGGVAHDFNNMLSVIQGYAEMALLKEKVNDPVATDLQIILNAAKKSADIVRQLLAFARKQNIAPRVVDMNATVESIFAMLSRLISEDIHLAWLPGETIWPVKVDPSQIDQILANLCVNARDSITGVGKITIETENSILNEDYCANHTGCKPGEYVRIAVSDTGCGMDKETLTHIFEPFYTTKGVGEGTGLGLATVYGIVKQNNGFINVYSEPGQGTTFSIYLPRYVGRDGQVQSKNVTEPAIYGNETILLVEDEPTILKMTMAMLDRLGYTVLATSTPGEAMRLASEGDGAIHLLLTDVIMPEMNGRTLAENLIARQPGMKCLFMSGYTANVISHHGVLDDGMNFIQKPFSIKELAAKIREALAAKGGM